MSYIVLLTFFYFAICSLCIKIFIYCRVCRRDRYGIIDILRRQCHVEIYA